MTLTARFDLAALARAQGKSGTVVFKPIAPRLWFETELYRIITGVLRAVDAHRPELIAAAAAGRSQLTRDAFSFSDIVGALRTAFGQATQLSRGKIESLFQREGRRHDERWIDHVNRVIGVDLKAVVTSADIAPTIELATQANVALIKGLTDEVAKRIETTILDLMSRGASNKEIARTLTEIGGFAKARAKLIAVDQAGKFNSALNELRYRRQAGIEEYDWSTVRDRRVRPAHRAREGQRFRWDSPPSDGHPGQPVRCRCIARAVLNLDPEKPDRSQRARARREGTAAVARALGIDL